MLGYYTVSVLTQQALHNGEHHVEVTSGAQVVKHQDVGTPHHPHRAE